MNRYNVVDYDDKCPEMIGDSANPEVTGRPTVP